MERRVVVGVDGSVGSLGALRRGVAEARLRDAVLVSVLAWRPPDGAGLNRRVPCPPALVQIWQAEAQRRLHTAWEQALGGTPRDLSCGLLIVRGPAGPVLVDVADRADDLLVLGAGRPGLRRVFGAGATARFCVAHAGCGVLTVPPSPWERELRSESGRRRLVRDLVRHSGD